MGQVINYPEHGGGHDESNVAVSGDIGMAGQNFKNISDALSRKSRVVVDYDGDVFINDTLLISDNTEFIVTPRTWLKQSPGINKAMVVTRNTFDPWSSISISWSSGKIATVTWTNHSLTPGKSIVINGATQPEWSDIFDVVTIVDVNTFTIALPFIPSAAPTGAILAKVCHENIRVDVNLDYNFTQNNTALSTNSKRMAGVFAFLKDSVINVRSRDVFKYGCLVAGAKNVYGRVVSTAPVNSDSVKLYGPLNNVTFDATAIAPEDSASIQALEPAAFINYMPCVGNVSQSFISVQASVTTAGSGAAVIYSDPTYTQDFVGVTNSKLISVNADIPALAIKPGATFSAATSKLKNVNITNCDIVNGVGHGLSVTTAIQKLRLSDVSFNGNNAPTTRYLINIAAGAVIDTLVVESSKFVGPWPGTTNYGITINGSDVTVNTIIFRNIVVEGASTLRFLQTSSSATVKKIIFEDCSFSNCDHIATLFVAGTSVVFRGGNYSNNFCLVNFRASGSIIFEGTPNISGATSGVIRAETAGTNVNVYASSPINLISGNLFVSVGGLANLDFRSGFISVPNILATGVLRSRGSECFSVAAAGTIPANTPVICDGTNWISKLNQSHTA